MLMPDIEARCAWMAGMVSGDENEKVQHMLECCKGQVPHTTRIDHDHLEFDCMAQYTHLPPPHEIETAKLAETPARHAMIFQPMSCHTMPFSWRNFPKYERRGEFFHHKKLFLLRRAYPTQSSRLRGRLCYC